MIFKALTAANFVSGVTLWAMKLGKLLESVYTWCVPTPLGIVLNLLPWPARGVALASLFSAGLVGMLYLNVLVVERQSYLVILFAIALVIMVQEGHVTRMLTADKTISAQLNAKQKNFIYSGRLALVLIPILCETAFFLLGMEMFLTELFRDAWDAITSALFNAGNKPSA